MIVDFISLFFPRSCLGCGGPMVRGEATICTRCLSEFPRPTDHLYHSNRLEERFAGRLSLEHAWAFLKFRKKGIVQQLLHHLKYNHHPEVGISLGRIFGRELKQLSPFPGFDLVVPVPLHESRRRKRGYNQSSKFAEGISYSLGIPWSDSVSIRRRPTPTQTRKSKLERWENVKDVFLASPSLISGKRVLLVDDVITTGATLEACGRSLVEAGCQELSIACIAEA